jgi:hypothetical protein
LISTVYFVIVQSELYFTDILWLHICRELYIDIVYIIEMPQNTYYSADEYYIDDNSADEHSSQESDHSSRRDVHKCSKCRPKSPPRPREKCKSCNEPKREKCNKCGKSHRRSKCESRERHSRCERHSKSDSKSECKSDCKSECKCKCEKKRSECGKTEKVIHDDCGKCIVIKIRPCK